MVTDITTPEDEKLWAHIDEEMTARTERCTACGGSGEVLGWSRAVDDTDLLTCGKCDGWGCNRPVSTEFL